MQITNPTAILNLMGLKSVATLGLKDGQQLSARVVSVDSQNALFNIRGEQVSLKLPENPLPLTPGTTVVFEVKQNSEGQLELHPLPTTTANSENAPQAAATASTTVADSGSASEMTGNVVDTLPSFETVGTDTAATTNTAAKGQPVMHQALESSGLMPTAENLKSLENLMSRLQLEQGIIATPKTAAFMIAKELPPTSGGYLLGWLQSNEPVREQMWNLFERAGMLNGQEIPQMNQESEQLAELISKAFINDNEAVKAELSKLLETEISGTNKELMQPKTAESSERPLQTAVSKEPLPEISKFISKLLNDPKNPVIVAGQDKAVLEQRDLQRLGEVLTDRSTWANLPDAKTADVNNNKTIMYNDIAFLVREPNGEVRECVVHWEKENEKSNSAVSKRPEILRMVVPTENMGDLQMELRFNDGRISLALLADETDVCEYLRAHESGFAAVIGKELALRVDCSPQKTKDKSVEGSFDIWL